MCLEASTEPHVHKKIEIFWTGIASTMACLNFKNGPKNGLHPLEVNDPSNVANKPFSVSHANKSIYKSLQVKLVQ